jgi:hypothetical protein
LHVHQHDRHDERGGCIQRAFAAQRAHVVDETCTGRDGGAHDFGFRGVDRDRHAHLARECFDDRNHAGDFGFGIDRFGARPRGFAANVEQVRAFFDNLQSLLDRALRLDEVSAIGKRIGRDVDDAADARAVEFLADGRCSRV